MWRRYYPGCKSTSLADISRRGGPGRGVSPPSFLSHQMEVALPTPGSACLGLFLWIPQCRDSSVAAKMTCPLTPICSFLPSCLWDWEREFLALLIYFMFGMYSLAPGGWGFSYLFHDRSFVGKSGGRHPGTPFMGHWPAWGALTWSPCFHGR